MLRMNKQGRHGTTANQSVKPVTNQNNHRRVPVLPSSNNASDGLLRSIMFPKTSQLFLAFATLLFILSFECFLLALVHIKPGRIGEKFAQTQCIVVTSVVHGTTTCHVDSLTNHGKSRVIPCLQIYVKPDSAERKENHSLDKINQQMNPSDTTWALEKISETKLPKVTSSPANESELEKIKNEVKFENNSRNESVFLMFEDERNYAGLDYLYRRCSYLPDFCDDDVTTMESDIYVFACQNGKVNSTIDCYYDANDERVILNKYVRYQTVISFALISCLGILVSTLCCIGFWKRNHNRISRLFVYNSWSGS